MSRPYDLVILGSGFAGSLLGLLLQKRGLSVLVIDRHRHPRFAIGESSTPAADFILESLCDEYDLPELRPLSRYGSWCRERPQVSRGLKRGFSYFHQREGERFATGPNHERELLVAASANDEVGDTHWYRADVDRFIAQLFVEAGGQLWEGTTVESIESGSNWELICGREGISTRAQGLFLVDGTGGNSGLVKTLGLTSKVEELSTHSRSVFAHFQDVRHWAEVLDELRFSRSDHPYPCDQAALHHIIDGGWMWMLRFDNGITSVGWTLDERRHPLPTQVTPREEWQQILDRYPSVSRQLRSATPALPFTAAAPIARTGRLQRLVSPAAGANWALLPHTAGFIDPLYSSGIAQSLLGVESLAAIFSESHSTERGEKELLRYAQRRQQETRLIDQLVALAYQTMGRDPRLLHAASMLYFSAATSFEAGRRRGEKGAFLLADNAAFRGIVDEICRTLPGEEAAAGLIDEWITQVETMVRPWNTVGLFHPQQPHMYWHTAAK